MCFIARASLHDWRYHPGQRLIPRPEPEARSAAGAESGGPQAEAQAPQRQAWPRWPSGIERNACETEQAQDHRCHHALSTGREAVLLRTGGDRPRASQSVPMGSHHAVLVPIEGLLALQVLVLLAGTAVHELGHALAARAVGFDVAGVRVGPLLALATPRGWRARFVWEMAVGGELLSVPARPDGLRPRHAAMIAAGPAAHLLMAVVALTAALFTDALALWFTAATLGLSALANLVPSRPRLGGRWTDGRWLLAWLVHPERATQRVALGVLQRAATGARPRDWDDRWARLAAAGPRQPADAAQVAGCLLAYAHALDRGETDRAGSLLTRAFAARHLLPAADQAALALQSAFFTARFRGNATLASRLLETGLMRPDRARALDVERARAAMHLAADRPADAAAACDRALAALDTAWQRPAGLTTFDRELLEVMRDRARMTSADQTGHILCSGGFVTIGQGRIVPSSTAGPVPPPDDPEDVGAGAAGRTD